MYAVIRSGGKQYKVSLGERVRVEAINAEKGATVEFDVLAVFDGTQLKVGAPLVASAKVTGTVVAQDKARKIVVFTFKRRKGFRRTRGHRQPYTEVLIENIAA